MLPTRTMMFDPIPLKRLFYSPCAQPSRSMMREGFFYVYFVNTLPIAGDIYKIIKYLKIYNNLKSHPVFALTFGRICRKQENSGHIACVETLLLNRFFTLTRITRAAIITLYKRFGFRRQNSK